MQLSPHKWLVCYRRNPFAENNLICFPFCGASASAYRNLARALPLGIQLWSVSLPGRENRYSEPFEKDSLEVMRAIAEDARLLGLKNISLFGHGMGADFALDFYRYMSILGGAGPANVILSGSAPPHIRPSRKWSEANDLTLMHHVLSISALPVEAMAERDFLDIYLRRIRADLVLHESICHGSQARVRGPLTVIYGRDDPTLNYADMQEWQRYSRASVRFCVMNGEHYYFQHNATDLAGHISNGLLTTEQVTLFSGKRVGNENKNIRR